VTPALTRATSERVLRQLLRDRRTLALVFLVPPVLLTLFRYVFDGQEETFDRVGAPLVGLFPLVSMFLVTSIAMLRERTTGTLERLMSTPIGKLDLLLGYGLAFALVAAVQATITSAVAFGLLGLDTEGPIWLVVAIAIANAVLGMALGLFLSAFARTEFQAVQFMPAFVLPQILLAGLLVPRELMAEPLQWLARLLPFTYAYDALAQVTSSGEIDGELAVNVGVVCGCIVVALALGAATLRRRTA
jgi:ABC-2 type transport system permease protein